MPPLSKGLHSEGQFGETHEEPQAAKLGQQKSPYLRVLQQRIHWEIQPKGKPASDLQLSLNFGFLWILLYRTTRESSTHSSTLRWFTPPNLLIILKITKLCAGSLFESDEETCILSFANRYLQLNQNKAWGCWGSTEGLKC